MSKTKFGKMDGEILNSRPYLRLSKIIAGAWALFGIIYLFRDNLYNMNNKYITLWAETAPNFLFSFLFTLMGVFYILPYFKGLDSANESRYIWLINLLNIIAALLIEYGHLVLDLGTWDNNDIIASLIGLGLSTVIYLRLKKELFTK